MKTLVTRRMFAGTLGAAVISPALPLPAATERPLLRIGAITDTHIGNTKESCARVKQAYGLFRSLSVDMVANVGDIADHHYPTGYVAYRECVEEAYAGVPAGSRPKELFVYAGHDAIYYKRGKLHDPASDMDAAADMKRLLKIPNGLYAEGEVNGFPYIAIPQSGYFGKFDEARFGKMVADAVGRYPGKPVFVFTHVPPDKTTRTGNGSAVERRVFDKYPQVVNLSGHVHGSLQAAHSIWQGGFTSVSVGCLQNWGLGLPGGGPVQRLQNYGALVVDVYSDRLVFRRFDVRDRYEDSPWIVPWPYDPASAPFRPEELRKTLPVPEFGPGAGGKIEFVPDATPFSSLAVTFPCADGAKARPFAYCIALSRKDGSGAWRTFARKSVFGEFYLRGFERPETLSCDFDATYFDPGREYRATVRPQNSLGVAGVEISKEFTAPAQAVKRKLVWKTDNPAADCVFREKGRRKPPDNDGFFEVKGGQATLSFPDGVWEGPAGARFMLTFDMQTVQEKDPCWSVSLRNLKPVPARGKIKALKNAAKRMHTEPGDSGELRYVVEFGKPADVCTYALLLDGENPGKVRFTCAKIERLDNNKERNRK